MYDRMLILHCQSVLFFNDVSSCFHLFVHFLLQGYLSIGVSGRKDQLTKNHRSQIPDQRAKLVLQNVVAVGCTSGSSHNYSLDVIL
jgi:hypothetical protein